MSTETKNKLVPRLRFPEFQNDGEWEVKRLGEVCEINNGKANAQDHIENGRYPLFDRSEVIKASNEFIFDTEAVIIPGEGMRFIPKYYKGKFNLHQRAYALNNFKCFGNFIYYSILNKSTILSHKAVQSTVLSLRLPILQNLNIELPKSLLEQQKIASCLSSLDELIEAESQKLELYELHKKGLMQNLFPNSLNCDSQGLNDGHDFSKVPKLRFPEFKDAGEWEVKRLGELCVEIKEKTNGRKFKLLSISSGQGLISQIEKFGKEIAGNSYSNYTVIRKNDFAYNKSSTKSYPEGEIALMEEEEDCAVPNSIFTCFRFKQNLIIPYFAKYLFVKNHHGRYLRTLIAIGARAHGALQISTRDLFSVPIPFPSLPEQQKIASCLSSLDDLINAQRQKIELLKQHKKGLLQNLFPWSDPL